MTVNVANLEFTIGQKLNSTANTAEMQMLAKALERTGSGPIVQTVCTTAQLPCAVGRTSQMFSVRCTCTLFYSDGSQWVPFNTTGVVNRLFGWGRAYVSTTGATRCTAIQEPCSFTNWAIFPAEAGLRHTGAITSDGKMWLWGTNTCGGLGDGTTTNRTSPPRQEICSATNWCNVAPGYDFTAAIKTDGTLWMWGRNNSGELADGTIVAKCSPIREICSATNWCRVSTGRSGGAALKTDGSLWSWGLGTCGQHGNGTATTKCSPVRELCNATNWCKLSASGCHTAALKTDGTLWTWGYNGQGQLGSNSATTRCSPVTEVTGLAVWTCVSTGSASCNTMAIKIDGSLWTWGKNAGGALADGTVTSRSSPVREILSATNWCTISAGDRGGSAIKTDGTLWSWGCNSYGDLGIGNTTNACSPVREICSFTDWCAVATSLTGRNAIRTKS